MILLLNLAPVQKFAIKTLEPILPWELSWDKLSIEALGGAIRVEGLKARGKDDRFFLDVESATARFRPWHLLRGKAWTQAALRGANATVVGVLLAALYNPIWTSAILSPRDFILALFAFVLLVFWKVAPWLVVVVTAIGGWVLSLIG